MKNGGDFWFRCLFVLVLAACGGSGKNQTTDQNSQGVPVGSFFQFKANVTGLNGQLVLTNRGEHEVAIQQNGVTTFPTTWTHEGQFEIKVLREPCDQRCTIDQASGQITTTGTKTLLISCSPKTWDYPLASSEPIGIPNTAAENPLVAMNKYGDMLLTWAQSDYFNVQGYQALYENRKWTKPTSITDHFTFAGSSEEDRAITLNDKNEASVFWKQTDGTNRALFLTDYEDGQWNGPVSSGSTLNVGGMPATQDHIVIRSNALGEKIAVWTQTAGANTKLYKAEYRNGGWTLPTNLIDNINPDGTDVSRVDAAINDLGDIVIAWQQSDGTYERIYKSEYHSGIWTHPSSLIDEISKTGTDAYEPKVAINNKGDAYVVWYQDDNATVNRFQVFVAEYHQGVWSIPSSLADNISPNGKNSKYPMVVANDAGEVKIASMYRVNDGVNVYQVAIQEKLSGSGWSSPMILSSTYSTSNPSKPQIGMDQDGNTLVVWALQNSGDVYKAEYRHGNWLLASLASPINFNPSTYDYPSVAVNNCRAAIAWKQNNNVGVEQIYVAQYH